MRYALKINQLTKTYKGGFQALKGISLQVEEGDFFSLLGPNGAGKSTVIGIMTSLVEKTAGRVSIFGYDLDTQKELAKACLGIVPQEINLAIFEKPMQVLINQAGYYGIPQAVASMRAEKYLKQLHLWDKRNGQILALSGGMKRRLMIARALMCEPKLLILDEPTAGVDIEIRRSMWAFLREVNAQGTTIILTTHYLEEAENLCRNLALIDQGQIKYAGPMRDFLSTLTCETFVFDIRRALTVAPKLEGFTCRLSEPTVLEINLGKDQDLNAVFARLSEQGIIVDSMHNKANRLEELFVRLTARAPEQSLAERQMAKMVEEAPGEARV